MALTVKKKQKKLSRGGKWFCLVVAGIAIIQWFIFYTWTRLNSILTSFQYFDGKTQEYYFYSIDKLFTNYKTFFNNVFKVEDTARLIFNGYKFWFFGWIISQFSLFIAFYLYKKKAFSTPMMFVLMLPGCLAGPTNPMLYKYFVEKALPYVAEQLSLPGNWTLLMSKPETALGTSLFMSAFFAFPGGMLFYTAQFNKISKELVESAQLDGISFMGEFIHIAFPHIYSIWSLSNLGILFTGVMYQGPGYSLFGANAKQYGVDTLGYTIFVETLNEMAGDDRHYFTYTAAVNMVTAILAITGVQIMRRVFNKLDPYREV